VLPAAFAASAIANWVRRRRARASKSAAAVPAAGPLLTPLAARGAHRAVARRATGHPPD
jgi:hypothetical protein